MDDKQSPGGEELLAPAPLTEGNITPATTVPMWALVTGAAGFIGSHLVERLLTAGHRVTGVDALTPYYDPAVKRQNLARAFPHPNFELVELDLSTADIEPALDGIDVVFHLAGQPGVRASWGAGFAEYVNWNILATQRLLEACRGVPIRRFVNSSSSSVYGSQERYPTRETDTPRPVSPYGVTKLSAENLATLYGTQFGVPTVSLRYFTVYGPRQRPDMAMHLLIRSAMTGKTFPLNGDGRQARDFTYVGDVVEANLLAASSNASPGAVFNVGGGAVVSLRDVILIVEELVGRPVRLDQRGPVAGDPRKTAADISSADRVLGWRPSVPVRTGLAYQTAWHRSVATDTPRQLSRSHS